MNKSKINKIIICILAIVVVVVAVVILINVFNTKPKKYKEYAKSVGEAFADETKMKKVIKDKVIDLRAAVAWREADFDPSNLDEVYKDINKDDERIEELEESLKNYAKLSECDQIKVTKIKKPEQCEDNKNIWTVQAVWEENGEDSETVTYVFYKGKIIDVNGNEDLEYIDSFFEMVCDYADMDNNPISNEKNNTEILFKVDNKFINRYGYITDYANYSVISVEGLKIDKNQEKIDEETFSKISNLISELKKNELIGKTIKIDVSNMEDVFIDMSVVKKSVKFGKLSHFSEKCKMIAEIIKIEDGIEGEIFVNVDLENGEKPYFRENV